MHIVMLPQCFILLIYVTKHTVQGVPKKTQTVENNLLLEFQCPSTNLQVKSAKYSDRVHILSIDVLRNSNIFVIFCPWEFKAVS